MVTLTLTLSNQSGICVYVSALKARAALLAGLVGPMPRGLKSLRQLMEAEYQDAQ